MLALFTCFLSTNSDINVIISKPKHGDYSGHRKIELTLISHGIIVGSGVGGYQKFWPYMYKGFYKEVRSNGVFLWPS